MTTVELATPEQRLVELGMELPAPPEPFGAYTMTVQSGQLLFLTGMLATRGHHAAYEGQVGVELDIATARAAARLAALNAIALARKHLGTLDRVRRIVRLGVMIASSRDLREHPRVADGASEVLQEVFGPDRTPTRLVYGVASLPLGSPVELELIFEIDA